MFHFLSQRYVKDLSTDCLLYISLWESSLMEKQETNDVVQPSSEAEYQGMAMEVVNYYG